MRSSSVQFGRWDSADRRWRCSPPCRPFAEAERPSPSPVMRPARPADARKGVGAGPLTLTVPTGAVGLEVGVADRRVRLVDVEIADGRCSLSRCRSWPVTDWFAPLTQGGGRAARRHARERVGAREAHGDVGGVPVVSRSAVGRTGDRGLRLVDAHVGVGRRARRRCRIADRTSWFVAWIVSVVPGE